MAKKPEKPVATSAPGAPRFIALYHIVRSHETFKDAAQMILETTQAAATRRPGQPRHLYLDIEGHRNEAGGFDHDMYEFQNSWLLGFFMPWLTKATIPLGGRVRSSKAQREDLPHRLDIVPATPGAEPERSKAQPLGE